MKLKNQIFWSVSLLGLLLDQVAKLLVINNLLLHETFPLIRGVFHFTYAINTGAAWSIFQGGVNWLKWLSLVVSVALMYFAYFGAEQKPYEQVGYGLILAGAFGNGIDRFIWGHVIDFLDFRIINFPIFNIADACINLGIICLLLGIFRDSPKKRDFRK